MFLLKYTRERWELRPATIAIGYYGNPVGTAGYISIKKIGAIEVRGKEPARWQEAKAKYYEQLVQTHDRSFDEWWCLFKDIKINQYNICHYCMTNT
ncbi:MAG: hypothetical protein EOP51_02185 [Sphingobacteriales bacterium]|nr:MAG: hypothetical protein EOP51_02185 [Sphingobacteriales bacterium]